MGKAAAAEFRMYFFGISSRIVTVNKGDFMRQRKNLSRQELAEGKLAGVTLLYAVVAVVHLGFPDGVLVFTVFNGHFFFQVVQTVERRIQHRKQERACQEKLPYGQFIFQTETKVKELCPSFGKIK